MSADVPTIEPADRDELIDWLRSNAAGGRRTLAPTGGGLSGAKYLSDRAAVMLGLRRLNRVIDYPARDMTITVEAGMTVAELSKILDAEGQRLPIDVPDADRATIGGILAANVAGSRRYGYGTLRDYLIGVTAVTSGGELFHAGGRVVKNVAGYDLNKLLIGSRGTLAVIADVTLKLWPKAEAQGWFCAGYSQYAFIEKTLQHLLTTAARPAAIDVLSPGLGRQVEGNRSPQLPLLVVGLEGLPADVQWQLEQLESEFARLNLAEERWMLRGDSARTLTSFLTQPVAPTQYVPVAFQLNVLPSKVLSAARELPAEELDLQIHAGQGIIRGFETRSAAAPESSPVEAAVEAVAKSHQGWVAWERDRSGRPWAAPLPSDHVLMPRIRKSLDPLGLLNPGILDVPATRSLS